VLRRRAAHVPALTGFKSKRIWIPEGLNNTYALHDFLTWCLTGRTTGTGFRYERDENRQIREWVASEPRSGYAERFLGGGALVFMVGVAEV
jgi:hypothetical protein